MATVRFNEGTAPLTLEEFGEEPKDKKAFEAMLEGVNKKIEFGSIDTWSQSNLGYVHFFPEADEEVAYQKRLTPEEFDWFYKTVLARSLDTKEWVWAEMEKRGAIKAIIEFSGGHDEGGADAITLTMGDGSKESLETWRNENDDEGRLITYLQDPLYDRWGSFAGEFSVYGTIEWNVTTRKVTLDGSESVEDYTSFTEEV